MSNIHKVFFAGFTGHLGQLIVKQLVADGFEVTAILRPGHGAKHAELLKSLNVKHIEANGKEELIAKTKGADAIISAVSGDGKVFLDYQLELLAAAKANKVKLFIPSEFGSDTDSLGANPGFFGYKVAVAQATEKEGVPHTLVQSGPFYEYALTSKIGFDAEKGRVEILGDGNVPIRRTAMKDIAKAISAILRTPNPPKHAYIASEVLTERQAVEVFEQVYGKKFEIVSKSREQWLQESEKATDFFPKFVSWLHANIDITNSHAVNFQIAGSQSIREFAQQQKAQPQQQQSHH